MRDSLIDFWNVLLKKQKISDKEEYTINRRLDGDT